MGEALLIKAGSSGDSSRRTGLITEIFTSNTLWRVPEGIKNNQVSVRIFGGGSCGDYEHGGCGGYMNNATLTLDKNTDIFIIIGEGGTALAYNAGGTTSFGTYLSANGGTIAGGGSGGGGCSNGGYLGNAAPGMQFGGGGGYANGNGGTWGGGGGNIAGSSGGYGNCFRGGAYGGNGSNRNTLAKSGINTINMDLDYTGYGNAGTGYGGGGGGYGGNGGNAVTNNYNSIINGAAPGGGGGYGANGGVGNLYYLSYDKCYYWGGGGGGGYGGDGGGGGMAALIPIPIIIMHMEVEVADTVN